MTDKEISTLRTLVASITTLAATALAILDEHADAPPPAMEPERTLRLSYLGADDPPPAA